MTSQMRRTTTPKTRLALRLTGIINVRRILIKPIWVAFAVFLGKAALLNQIVFKCCNSVTKLGLPAPYGNTKQAICGPIFSKITGQRKTVDNISPNHFAPTFRKWPEPHTA